MEASFSIRVVISLLMGLALVRGVANAQTPTDTFESIISWAQSRLAVDAPSSMSALLDMNHDIATMHWVRDDVINETSGVTTDKAFTRVFDGTGGTIVAHATCDDGFNNFLIGADEDIEIDFYRGVEPSSILWDGQGITTVQYKVDKQDPTTIHETESGQGNTVVINVGFADMSTARHYTVTLNLSDGARPIFDFNPTDPVMRAFTNICEQKFAGDNPMN
jgi:hypothetical protein